MIFENMCAGVTFSLFSRLPDSRKFNKIRYK